MARTKEQKLAEVHDAALSRFDDVLATCQYEREECLADRRFVHVRGATWEGALGEQFENRPQLETNEASLAVLRIVNEYRNNRITANFVSRTGDDSDELADLCDGLYRADELDSTAEEAYDNAFSEGVSGGMGAFRLRTEYEDEYDEDNDYQRIRFEPIYDADSSVFFDSNAKRYDKSDAKYCFVVTGMSEEAYKAEYDDDPQSWSKNIRTFDFDWSDGEMVYVAEYYTVQDTTEVVHKYRKVSGDIIKVLDADLDDEKKAEFAEVGTIPVSSKRVKRRKVRKYVLSGGGVLSDEGFIAGEEIPIVPFYGQRVYIDGIERVSGHVRGVKDMIRLRNMQISVIAERAADGGESLPLMTPEQVEGHEVAWANKAVDRPPYLLINAIEGANGEEIPSGPVGYTQPPQVSPAEAALLDVSKQEISDLLGNQQGGDEISANVSGYAVELVQNRLDMQSYIYMSNFAKSVKRAASIWLSIARVIYDDDGRKMKVMDRQDEPKHVEVGRRVLVDGRPEKEADISKARFDVAVDVGPASQTKRQAIIKALTDMLGVIQDPADAKVLSATIMRNMEGEGLASIREHFRQQLVKMGVEEPTEEEAEAMAAAEGQQEPDPQVIYLQTEADKNRAQAAESMADTQYKKAKTAETLAGISRADREQAVKAAQAIAQAVGSGTAAPQAVRQ